MCGRLRVGKSFFHILQRWSVQPCVRPFSAVHMTAGHNALRRSGPDQKLAFKNAMAHVGCPDRRIDRLCITCCSPSQPSHRASCPARFRSSRKREGFLVSLAPCHHSPDHSGDLVGERDSRNLGRPPCQQSREPGPMCGAMNLGVTDDSERAGHDSRDSVHLVLILPSGLCARYVVASSASRPLTFRYSRTEALLDQSRARTGTTAWYISWISSH